MKNSVDEIIKSFTRDELREFKYFVTRRNNVAEEREDVNVITAIRNGAEVPDNVRAYRQTKNRIKKQLEHFLAIENIRFRDTSRIINMLEVASYLFRKNLYNHAWDYIVKAEQMAIEKEEYELLNYIYYIQISYTYNIAVPPSPKIMSVEKLLERRDKNLSYAKTDGNANAAYAYMVHEIRQQFSKKFDADIDQLVDEIYQRYDLKDVIYYDQMKIYCRTVNMVCRALREKREYVKLKSYAINSFLVIKRKKMVDKIPIESLMDLLDVICISALRSKDYINYEKYQIMYTEYARKMMRHPDEYSYYDFIPFIDAADLYLCTNRLEKARERLLTLYQKYQKYVAAPRIYFLLRVNLIAMHFAGNEYKKCIRMYQEIMSFNENRILSEPGFRLELMIFTDIYGAICYYENDDAEYATLILKKIRRKYAEALQQQQSERESMFIRMMEKIFNNPSYITSKRFKADYEKFRSLQEFIPGDNEYISMTAWLESKLTGESYYTCFLRIVN